MQIDHKDIEEKLKRLSEMDTSLMVQQKRVQEMEKALEKAKKDAEIERQQI